MDVSLKHDIKSDRPTPLSRGNKGKILLLFLMHVIELIYIILFDSNVQFI